MNEPNNKTIYDKKQKPMMTRTKTTNNQKTRKRPMAMKATIIRKKWQCLLQC